jgi:phage shock protein A
MEQKIEQREAEVEAQSELSEEYSGYLLKNKFQRLEATAGADADLEALKREMGMAPPAEAKVAARVEAKAEEAEMSAAEMAELEEALAALKKREDVSAKG